MYVVRLERGGPWDWSRDLRQQAGWDEHARFMDGLVESGFVLLGGPLEGEHEVLLIVDAASEEVVRERLARDLERERDGPPDERRALDDPPRRPWLMRKAGVRHQAFRSGQRRCTGRIRGHSDLSARCPSGHGR